MSAHGASEFIELSTTSGELQSLSHSKTTIAPWKVVTGDFDLDGKTDYIVASPGTTSEKGGVSFWRAGASSAWSEAASHKIGLGTYAVAAQSGAVSGEVVAVGASYATQALVPFIGHAGATPTAGTSLTLDIKPTALLFGSNSRLYVIGNGPSRGRLIVYTSNGGALSKVSSSASFGKSLNDLKLGDLNGDGLTDVVAVDDSDSSSLFSLAVDAKFNWNIAAQRALPANSHAVTLDDFDRDGKLDCATISGSTTTVQMCFGDGKGAFGNCIELQHGVEQPTDIVSKDLNADRWVDIIVVGYTGRVSVLHGAPSED